MLRKLMKIILIGYSYRKGMKLEIVRYPNKKSLNNQKRYLELKDQITFWVKYFGIEEYYTPWSHKGVLYGIDYLKSYLIYIVTNIKQNNKQINKPELNTLIYKTLPTLGDEIADLRDKYKKDDNLRESLKTDYTNI